jgi:4-hydroxybenzoate polyprenyltransferase
MPSNNYASFDSGSLADSQALTVIERVGILAKLFRVANSALLGSLAVFSVTETMPGTIATFNLSLVFLSWTFVAATAYGINDLVDRITDRVNRPARYLQRVDHTPRWIIVSVCIAALMAIITGVFVPIERFVLLEIVWSCCAIGYSFGVKRRSGLLANLLSALCVTGSATPGLLQGSSRRLIGFLPVLFLLMLAREIWKDVEDQVGDAIAGFRTLPILRGRIFAARVACIISAAAFLFLIFYRPYAPNIEIVVVGIGVTGLIASGVLFADPLFMSAGEIQRLHRYTAILVFALVVIGSGLA